MKLVVIVPTFGRQAQVARLLRELEAQTRPPDHVIVSAPDESHVDMTRRATSPSRGYLAGPGSVRMGNALAEALGHYDIVTFFDDDFLPADDYLARVSRRSTASPTSPSSWGGSWLTVCMVWGLTGIQPARC